MVKFVNITNLSHNPHSSYVSHTSVKLLVSPSVIRFLYTKLYSLDRWNNSFIAKRSISEEGPLKLEEH